MTVEELNDYINYTILRSDQRNYKRDVRKCRATTFLYFKEQPYKNEAIKFVIQNRSEYVATLYELGYITINDILELEKELPEIYYCLPYSIYNAHPELIDNLLANDQVIYDLLPKQIRFEKRIQDSFKRKVRVYNDDLKDKEEYGIDWINEEGKLKEFFELKTNFPIKTKEDYIKIIGYYLNSEMTIPSFCYRYGIKNVESFRGLLKRVGYENVETEREIAEQKAQAGIKFLKKVDEITQKIDNKEITFTDLINDYYNGYFKFDLIYSKSNNKLQLIKEVIDYMINNKEELKFGKLLNLFNTDAIGFRAIMRSYMTSHQIFDNTIRSEVHKVIDLYSKSYNRSMILTTIIKNGQNYVIDDNVIDQALVYLKDNDIHPCSYTVSNTSRKIAFGTLDYSFEAEEAKEELKSEILKMALSKAKDIDDYMEIMGKTNNK